MPMQLTIQCVDGQFILGFPGDLYTPVFFSAATVSKAQKRYPPQVATNPNMFSRNNDP